MYYVCVCVCGHATWAKIHSIITTMIEVNIYNVAQVIKQTSFRGGDAVECGEPDKRNRLSLDPRPELIFAHILQSLLPILPHNRTQYSFTIILQGQTPYKYSHSSSSSLLCQKQHPQKTVLSLQHCVVTVLTDPQGKTLVIRCILIIPAAGLVQQS